MRLIDADELQRDMMDMVASGMYGLEDMIDAVIEAPTIDAVPVVHGEWIRQGAYFWRCSVCDTVTDYNGHYCPNCGARMDGATEYVSTYSLGKISVPNGAIKQIIADGKEQANGKS